MNKTYVNLLLVGMVVFGVTSCSLDQNLTTESDDYTTMNLALITESIEAFPEDSLSAEEISGLVLMREEEKLARDVYLHLYEIWRLRIFSNIASSEDTHMGALKILLDRYELEDPVLDDVSGNFQNEELENLYTTLCSQGEESLVSALQVGATIEDLDIMDLMELSEITDNADILFAYESLTKGSRNHIRSFVSKLESYDLSYAAQFMDQALLDSILASPKELGNW